MVGGSLELIALGWMNVGAAMAPDSALASTVSTIIAVASVGDASSTKGAIAAAIGVAVPLAVAGQALTIFVRTIAIFFAHQADRFAEQANYRGIAIMHFTTLGLQGLRVAIPTAAVAALASGDTVKHALDAIPKVITEGLGIAGGFIVVVGYAMVINMMKARKLMPFLLPGLSSSPPSPPPWAARPRSVTTARASTSGSSTSLPTAPPSWRWASWGPAWPSSTSSSTPSSMTPCACPPPPPPQPAAAPAATWMTTSTTSSTELEEGRLL